MIEWDWQCDPGITIWIRSRKSNWESSKGTLQMKEMEMHGIPRSGIYLDCIKNLWENMENPIPKHCAS